MSATAQDQVARMLALVPYLRERGGISVDEVARAFAVPPTQIVKDLKVLWFCGLPNSVTGDMIDIDMEALDGAGVVKLSNADYLTRPLRLARHEALALTVALRALLEIASTTERESIEHVLGKLEAAAGDVVESASAVGIQVFEDDPLVRSSVDLALRSGRQLDLSYYVPARDETTQRVVDPIRLVYSEGRAYLEAWCHRAEEVRLFRLDRIIASSVLDSPSEPPPGASRGDLSGQLFRPDPSDPVAIVDLDASARWVADYFPVEAIEDRPDGSARVRLRFSQDSWLVRLVLRLGGHAVLVEPASLRSRVTAIAKAALANYETTGQRS